MAAVLAVAATEGLYSIGPTGWQSLSPDPGSAAGDGHPSLRQPPTPPTGGAACRSAPDLTDCRSTPDLTGLPLTARSSPDLSDPDHAPCLSVSEGAIFDQAELDVEIHALRRRPGTVEISTRP